MRNWLFAALGAVGLVMTGIGAASAAPPSGHAMTQDRSPTAHAAPHVQRTDYEWRHHRYQHRRWEHRRWHYWN